MDGCLTPEASSSGVEFFFRGSTNQNRADKACCISHAAGLHAVGYACNPGNLVEMSIVIDFAALGASDKQKSLEEILRGF